MKHVNAAVLTIALAAGATLAHPGHAESEEPSLEVAQNAQPGTGRGERPGGPPGAGPGDGEPAEMEVVDLPEPTYEMVIEGDLRIIRANGLPEHETGAFPNKDNPNALRAQSHEIRLPLHPKAAAEPTPARPEFGIALNGVIFDAGTGEFWTAERERAFGGGSPWNYEALSGAVPLGLDQNNAHVQPTGKYHYHGVPTGLLNDLAGDEPLGSRMIQLGWAYDGFPIYAQWGYEDADDATSDLKKLNSSYRLKSGERPAPPDGPGGKYDGSFGLDYEYVEGLGDLDECNGRFGVTPEFPDGTYYYVISDEFPAVPRLWKGQPDASQRRGPPPDGQGRGERPRRRPSQRRTDG